MSRTQTETKLASQVQAGSLKGESGKVVLYPLEKPRVTPSGKPVGPRQRRVTLMGGRGVGKSTLLSLFSSSTLPSLSTLYPPEHPQYAQQQALLKPAPSPSPSSSSGEQRLGQDEAAKAGGVPGRYYPTIEDVKGREIEVKGKKFRLEVLDLGGVDEYSILSPRCTVSYQGWVLVYSVDSRKSFDIARTVHDKLASLLTREAFPVVLVGNKVDLASSGQRQVSTDEGAELARSWGGSASFVETSCRANENGGVERVFERIVETVEGEVNPGPWGLDPVNPDGSAYRESNGSTCVVS